MTAWDWDRGLGVIALVSVAVAWIVGWSESEQDLVPFLSRAIPEATRFEVAHTGVYAAWKKVGGREQAIGYAAIGQATGYGGPLQLVVGIDRTGRTCGLVVVEHRESAAYFQRVMQSGFSDQLLGKPFDDPFRIGQDLDGVTGATRTAAAMAESARSAALHVARTELNLPIPPEASEKIEFGFPELVLLCLFGVALFNQTRQTKRKRLIRWVCLVSGLILVGWILNAQLTLTNINSFLLGYWPRWQTHFYWYLLITGVLIIPLATGKNPYCRSICPFGATQECLAVVGGAKQRVALRWRRVLRWLPRLLAWTGIVLALIYRNPALGNYEVYGTFFDLVGSHLQFGLLAVVLVASLFVKRPWCNYLCPVRAVIDFINLMRNMFKQRSETQDAVDHAK